MAPDLAAFLQSWPFAPWSIAGCVLAIGIYWRGWRALARRGDARFGLRHFFAFTAGQAAILLAVASPLEPFADLFLSVHMAQHLLLMFVAPPLVWLSAPQLPLMHGTPTEVIELWVLPTVRSRWIRLLSRACTHPFIAWLAAALALWVWHVPALYELALRSTFWHRLEHVCFLVTALMFWWPVVQPYPSRAVWPRVAVLAYLFLAAMQAGVLCALLTFADRVLYPHYDAVPRIAGISALTDQEIAGAMMWVAGILAYLVPLVCIGHELLYASGKPGANSSRCAAAARPALLQHVFPSLPILETALLTQPSAYFVASANVDVSTPPSREWGRHRPLIVASPPRAVPPRSPLPVGASDGLPRAVAGALTFGSFDLLRLPVVGRLLIWPYTRRLMQFASLTVAAAIVLDGLTGPQIDGLNLAGVLPWIHWRGLVVLTLLAAGNFWCMACPFTLPRAVARRLRPPRSEWPAWLRSKWLAIGLLGLFFWAYEALDLWASPWWTAWVVVGYFVAAFTVDSLFRGAAFCKFVCPIGQFQFVQSLVSPLEVRVRDGHTCETCGTKECIRGAEKARGCEMQLFAPRKTGNLDCTFCLDCVRACPVANIGVLASAPGAQLSGGQARAGSDGLLARPDIAAMIWLLVFAAFANAAGMIAPVVVAEDVLVEVSGLARIAVESAYLLVALVILPVAVVMLADACSRGLCGDNESRLDGTARFASAFVPLGAAMWLAHYGFHLATGAANCVPATLRFLGDWGLPIERAATLSRRCCAVEPPPWLLRAEILCLDVGLLASLYLTYRIATSRGTGLRQAVRAFLPWGILAVALFAVGVWILLEPMEMRGTTGFVAAWPAGGAG